MIDNMMLKRINSDNYDYDEIRHKIETFKNNGRLTGAEVEELLS